MSDMITLLFGFMPAVLVLGYIVTQALRKAPAAEQAPVQGNLSATQEAEPPVHPRLKIAGTRSDRQPWLTNSVLKGHAVPLQYLRDIAWYELKSRTQLPADVAGCLVSCYRDGLARGTKVRDLAVSGKGRPGDKLVFALVDTGGSSHIVALVA